jgi:hypothetical protein
MGKPGKEAFELMVELTSQQLTNQQIERMIQAVIDRAVLETMRQDARRVCHYCAWAIHDAIAELEKGGRE